MRVRILALLRFGARLPSIGSMNLQTLRSRLAEVNLSHLAKASGVSLRAIRRVKNVPEAGCNVATVEKLAAALRKLKQKAPAEPEKAAP